MMCWCQKNVIFRWGQKTGQKHPFWTSFSRPSKTAIFDHFSCIDEFWRFHDVLTRNFDDEMVLTTCWWWCRWRKSCSRGQKMTKKRPSAKPNKNEQNGARHGRRETAERKIHKERLWRDRVRMACDALKKNLSDPWECTSSASVAMCEAFFDTCAAYSQSDLSHTWDSWKQARASVAKCVRVS
jgi:hypothetical protein